MKLEQLQKMQAAIETVKIKGKNYAMVFERIKALRQEMPNASIETKIISIDDGSVIMKATVLDEDGRVLGTGHAEEKEGSTNINRTSYIENCETSAVGRALGMCGIGIDASFASADEVANATEQRVIQDWETKKANEQITPVQASVFKTICEKHGKTPTEGYEHMTAAQYDEALRALESDNADEA